MENIQKETEFIKWIVLLPIIAVMITGSILTNIFISSRYESFQTEVYELEKQHIKDLKQKIEYRIENLSVLLQTNYNNQIIDSKNNIKNMVYVGHSLLLEIYNSNKNLSTNQLYTLIHNKMKDIRFFDDKSGYFFIWNLENAVSVSLPSKPSFIGTSLAKLEDKKGKKLFDSYKKIIDERNEGFDTWNWYKPDSLHMEEKIGFIKRFEPLNLGIGTAVYVDDIKKHLFKNSIEFIRKLEYNDNSYIFVLDKGGTALLHKNRSIENLPIKKLDKEIQKNVANIISSAEGSKGTFIEYMQSQKLFEDFKPSKKISYVKYIPQFDWIIGTGLYTNKLNEQVINKQKKLESKLDEDIRNILLVSVSVSFVIIVILLLISRRIKNIISTYSKKLNTSNNALKKLNQDLEEKVSIQVSDLRQKDIILNQQSKLAAMGEMLGNIAHQWRQPLSAISVLASGIRVKKNLSTISDEQLDKDLENIVNTTKVLSNTIDDFRDFYSDKKELVDFSLKELVNQVISLIDPNLKNKNIKIIYSINDVKLSSYKNELIQALLNIVNNAKDALLNKEDERLIFIKIYQKDNYACIEVLDNAFGIKEEIISRIFEPYFTTKFKSQGTGIGLYMTKKIVESSLQGKIYVKNKEYSYENKTNKGACFYIKIPFELKKSVS